MNHNPLHDPKSQFNYFISLLEEDGHYELAQRIKEICETIKESNDLCDEIIDKLKTH